MSDETDKTQGTAEKAVPTVTTVVWQPFTFRGVAAFAKAPISRLFLLQVIVALLASVSAARFFGHCYSPVITQSVEKLPAAAGVTNGQLTGFPTGQFTETKFLSIAIPGEGSADSDQSADMQITLRSDYVEISSILSSALGSLDFDYGTNRSIDLSRGHLEPLWEAWQPAIMAGIGAGLFVSLLIIWAVLAALYAPAAKFVAWYFDRELSWLGAWRLASASLLTAALLPTLGVLLYSWQRVDLFGLGYYEAAHFLTGWVYVLASPVFLPRQSSLQTKRNPFQ